MGLVLVRTRPVEADVVRIERLLKEVRGVVVRAAFRIADEVGHFMAEPVIEGDCNTLVGRARPLNQLIHGRKRAGDVADLRQVEALHIQVLGRQRGVRAKAALHTDGDVPGIGRRKMRVGAVA